MSLEGRTADEIAALAELANTIANNPETRRDFLRLTKKINPGAAIPEIDIPASLASEFKPALDRLAQLEKDAQEREIRDRIHAGRRKALEVQGVTEADMPAIEKIMTDNSIATHAAAAKVLAAERKLAEPTASSYKPLQSFTMPKVDTGEFKGNLRGFARGEAYRAIDELRGRRLT